MSTLPALLARPLALTVGGLVAASVLALDPAAASAADTGTNPRVANGAPVPPGGVALTWSPAYMTDSHAFTAANATTMAQKFDLVAAMPIAFNKYVTSMRQTNPDLSLLAYANATLANEKTAAGLPESAYAHDQYGDRIFSPDWQEHLMESSSPAWRDRASAQCVQRSQDGGYDGCLVDMLILGLYSDAGLTGGIPVNPATGQLYTQPEYRQQMIELAAHYRAKSPQLAHLGNSIENAWRYWQDKQAPSRPLATSQPGAQIEDFLRGAFGSVSRFPSAADWVRNVDVIRDMQNQGSVVLASTKLWVNPTDAETARWQAYSMATFLMGAQGKAYYSFSRTRNITGVLNANVPYSMPKQIGLPKGAMVALANGAYTRSFANGMSVVNPTTSTVTVELGAPLRTLDGRTVTSLTLGPNTGDVLVGSTPDVPVDPIPDPEPSDETAPTVSIRHAKAWARSMRVGGNLRDNTDVDRVMVAIRNERTGKWKRADGSWGSYTQLPTRKVTGGEVALRWSKFLRLKPGRYGVSVIGYDEAGNTSTDRPWKTLTLKKPHRKHHH